MNIFYSMDDSVLTRRPRSTLNTAKPKSIYRQITREPMKDARRGGEANVLHGLPDFLRHGGEANVLDGMPEFWDSG